MITMEMAGMASRLTEQARRDAGAKIDRWRGAIEVVRQAEKQGDMTINLPTHLTVAANRAASAIYTADYVSAIGMAQQAIEAHQQVLEIATTAVQQEAHQRSVALTQATRNSEIVEQAHESTTASYKYPSLPEPPDTWGLVKIGFLVCIGVGVLWVLVDKSVQLFPIIVRVPFELLFLHSLFLAG